MTDRELLELAAKAAKHDFSWRKTGNGNDVALYIYGGRDERGFLIDLKWNPLEDDGDALRLAVDLNIRFAGEWISEVVALVGIREFREESTKLYAATRRAIVRAAAYIGEQMK